MATQAEEKLGEREHLIGGYRFATNREETLDHSHIQMSPRKVKLFTPRTKGVYEQYVKDSEDNLLIDGYFRENNQNMSNRSLPHEVNRVIAAYYLKSYSIAGLRQKLKPLCTEILYLCSFVLY